MIRMQFPSSLWLGNEESRNPDGKLKKGPLLAAGGEARRRPARPDGTSLSSAKTIKSPTIEEILERRAPDPEIQKGGLSRREGIEGPSSTAKERLGGWLLNCSLAPESPSLQELQRLIVLALLHCGGNPSSC